MFNCYYLNIGGKMAENSAVYNQPNIETVKRLLLEDLHRTSAIDTENQHESTFCEVEDEVTTPNTKLAVNRTYSRQTPRKRVLKSLENTLYSPKHSPNTIQKHKRKKVVEEEDDAANRSIIEITEKFKKVDDFQLAVE